ncbi:class I SAM-dependent methyltransferase [Streptosporangium lutulentum]
MTGIDASAGILELARRRLGAARTCGSSTWPSPLPFSDEAFDDVIASLVLHYLEDWGPTLAELRRVLRPGGYSSSRSIIHSRSPSCVTWQGRSPAISRPVSGPKNGPWAGRPSR